MHRMITVMEMVLMCGGRGFMRGGVARAGQGPRKQDARKIENREP